MFCREKQLSEILEESERWTQTKMNVQEHAISLGFDKNKVKSVVEKDPTISLNDLISAMLSNTESAEQEATQLRIRQEKTIQRNESVKELALKKEDSSQSSSDGTTSSVEELELPNLEAKSWYYGDLSRQKAEEILSKQTNNALIVRDSAQGNGFVVSSINPSTK